MDANTPVYARPSFYAGLLAVAAPVAAAIFKVNVTDADTAQLADGLAALGAAVGGIIVVIDHIVAHFKKA